MASLFTRLRSRSGKRSKSTDSQAPVGSPASVGSGGGGGGEGAVVTVFHERGELSIGSALADVFTLPRAFGCDPSLADVALRAYSATLFGAPVVAVEVPESAASTLANHAVELYRTSLHPNILPLYGVCRVDDKDYLLFPNCPARLKVSPGAGGTVALERSVRAAVCAGAFLRAHATRQGCRGYFLPRMTVTTLRRLSSGAYAIVPVLTVDEPRAQSEWLWLRTVVTTALEAAGCEKIPEPSNIQVTDVQRFLANRGESFQALSVTLSKCCAGTSTCAEVLSLLDSSIPSTLSSNNLRDPRSSGEPYRRHSLVPGGDNQYMHELHPQLAAISPNPSPTPRSAPPFRPSMLFDRDVLRRVTRDRAMADADTPRASPATLDVPFQRDSEHGNVDTMVRRASWLAWHIPPEEIRPFLRPPNKPVGNGAFGEVYRGKYLGADVAIKRIHVQTEESRVDFANEAQMLRDCRHENIVLFRGIAMDESELFLLTEFCPHGDLFDILMDHEVFLWWKDRLSMALDVAKALAYLHYHRGLIHRDLKSKNLLLANDFTVKVSDFGLARFVSLVHPSMTQGGTFCYMAPEELRPGPKTAASRTDKDLIRKVDVFSFGIVLCEIITRQDAEDHIPRTNDFGVDEPLLRDMVDDYCPPALVDLALRCCTMDPTTRPTFKEIVDELEGMASAASAADEALRDTVSIPNELYAIPAAPGIAADPTSRSEEGGAHQGSTAGPDGGESAPSVSTGGGAGSGALSAPQRPIPRALLREAMVNNDEAEP